MDQNPYAVEASTYLAPQELTDVESIRKRYLGHEASVKSIGTLYLIGGVFSLLISTVYIIAGISSFGDPSPSNFAGPALELLVALAVGAGFLSLGVLQIWSGIGVRKLRPAARIGATVISAIGLLGFPIGTLVSAYFLYLLLSEKGSYVFSDAYKQVIALTPHMRYKTSILTWIVVILLVSLVLLVIVIVPLITWTKGSGAW
jgi:hypothetical protein